VPCQHGLALAIRFVIEPLEGTVFDYLPAAVFDRVRNLNDFARHARARQVDLQHQWPAGRVLEENPRQEATFIDQGYCFNAGDWDYPDSPLGGVYPRNEVYAGVNGWESFGPWLSRIENFDPRVLWELAEAVPPEWYGSSLTDMERLIEQLISRRSKVRELIDSFRNRRASRFRIGRSSSRRRHEDRTGGGSRWGSRVFCGCA
jgi:hypothetical protein